MCNAVVDALENIDIGMLPLRVSFFIEILYKPSVADNITNLCIFYDEKLYALQNHFVGPVNVNTYIPILSHEHINLGKEKYL